MKNLILFCTLVVSVGFFSCAQDSAFRQRNTDTVQSRSAIDEDEELDDATEEENEVEIELSDLPQAVLDAIARSYAGSALKEADRITQDDGSITYDVEITREGEVIEVMYDAEGNFLGEESDNE